MNVRRDEQAAIGHAAARLKSAFPSVDPDTVDALVEQAHDALSGATIRIYVPILVERRARTMITDGLGPFGPSAPPEAEHREYGATAWHAHDR
ncbi:three-helix bundle dimerization domain-containing protein [Embleya hyalina]|uniref:Uncharacterized protein n=1 Tax=Embleya hyalina TaxID=516124 RepID=A0A401Z1M6_9ACTN|nr:hypothetical protein [Embleya hyalina]GCE00732.1 hypothetical protein EHYA_08458 [Embleya hyalina]